MNYLPVFANLTQQHCLIIGGNNIALRKAELLLKANAQVTIVSIELTPELHKLVESKQLQHRQCEFSADLLQDCRLLISTSTDNHLNQHIYDAAQAANVWVNVVDHKELCTFIMPAIVDRSPLIIAASSGGDSPVLTRKVREQLESQFPAKFGRLAKLAGKFRDEIKQALPDVTARRYFWESVFDGPLAEQLMQTATTEQGMTLLRDELSQEQQTLTNRPGEVYLVGAGPGDPDLLTFRALRLMQQADIVIHDRLISTQILDLVRRDVERIYVGKTAEKHTMVQEDINQLMVDLALQGKRVCRLKGGDPFIFGRGGEELQMLIKHEIPFQVVPAVTSAIACAAYAGIPLTHRDHALSVTFVTGHLQKDQQDPFAHIDWQALVRKDQTVVFYMGLKNIQDISYKLQQHGMEAERPAAFVENGTLENQRTVTGTIGNLTELAQTTGLKAPALLIIGNVVKLHNELRWYNAKNSG